eukprot:scaffold117618_cov35-Prasinocladus_malaysianus.AAC.2
MFHFYVKYSQRDTIIPEPFIWTPSNTCRQRTRRPNQPCRCDNENDEPSFRAKHYEPSPSCFLGSKTRHNRPACLYYAGFFYSSDYDCIRSIDRTQKRFNVKCIVPSNKSLRLLEGDADGHHGRRASTHQLPAARATCQCRRRLMGWAIRCCRRMAVFSPPAACHHCSPAVDAE